MTDASLYIQNTLQAEPLRQPLLRSVIKSLGLSPGSRGLDAGCGIGLQALLLADAIGQGGQIIGLDILPELLTYGQHHLRQPDDTPRINFGAGDVSRLPFADQSFDWAWSVDCIGYPSGEMAHILAELRRVVRPAGSILLLAWSSQQLLPGYPLLEARLNATCSAYIPYLEEAKPELNFIRAAHSFRQAGLEDVTAQTFVGDVQAPLSLSQRTALLSQFNMLWGQPQPGVSPEDWQAYQRLCTPGSAEFILDLPDYYAFFTYTLFRGKVPAG
jgi:demethylmenaquinone methyltransferase/2-methoxy-6-polyprenyl-1,4-benzoquinol methylase